MISIVAVNFNTSDWCDILIDSIIKNSEEKHEIIIVDNSGEVNNPHARVIKTGKNLGHSGGADLGVREAMGEFILLLDIDSHILRKGWENDLLGAYKSDEKIKIVGAKGGDLKPYRPCAMFFEKKYFIDNNFSFAPVNVKDDFSLDVGVYFAMKTLHSGFKIAPLEVGKKFYENVWGDTYYLDSKPTFYHNWYSSRFTGREMVDGRKVGDFKIGKDNLFKQYEENSNSNNSI